MLKSTNTLYRLFLIVVGYLLFNTTGILLMIVGNLFYTAAFSIWLCLLFLRKNLIRNRKNKLFAINKELSLIDYYSITFKSLLLISLIITLYNLLHMIILPELNGRNNIPSMYFYYIIKICLLVFFAKNKKSVLEILIKKTTKFNIRKVIVFIAQSIALYILIFASDRFIVFYIKDNFFYDNRVILFYFCSVPLLLYSEVILSKFKIGNSKVKDFEHLLLNLTIKILSLLLILNIYIKGIELSYEFLHNQIEKLILIALFSIFFLFSKYIANWMCRIKNN